MGVLYGVGVTFDQLFHLPQVGLLDFLKLLLTQTNPGDKENKPNHPVSPKSGMSPHASFWELGGFNSRGSDFTSSSYLLPLPTGLPDRCGAWREILE